MTDFDSDFWSEEEEEEEWERLAEQRRTERRRKDEDQRRKEEWEKQRLAEEKFRKEPPAPLEVHGDQELPTTTPTTSNVSIDDHQTPKPLKSHTPTIHQALNEIVTSSMLCTDVVALLTNHGCDDLTESLDQSTCSRYPVANGGLGDVFSGRLHDGTAVAIKTIRSYYEPGQHARVYHKRAAKEIYTWSKCKHPNVVTMAGLAVFRDCLAMISRWEDNGSLLQYLSRHPAADRCTLSTYICAGLVYLHHSDIVHGDLKGANVLISSDGMPRLMDFGNATLLDATLQFTQTSTGARYSLRWTPPEILEDEGTSLHTMAGDIYSLGMTILETFTSEVPFADKSEKSVLAHILFHKKPPARPEKIIPTRSMDGNKLWVLLTKCWSYDPKDRPSAEAVWNNMKPITSENLRQIEGEDEVGSKHESGEIKKGDRG